MSCRTSGCEMAITRAHLRFATMYTVTKKSMSCGHLRPVPSLPLSHAILSISPRPPHYLAPSSSLYLTHPYFILYFIYLLSIFHPISFHPISFPIPLHVSSACRFCGSFCFPLRLCPLSYSTFVMVSPSRLMRPSSARWRISLTMEVRLAVMFARMSRMVVPCGCDAR